MLLENDEQLQSNGGSDGVKYLTMIGPRDSGQPAQSINSGSTTAAKYLTIVGSKDSVQSPQLNARDSGQLSQPSNVGTLGYMKLSFTQSQLGDDEYMELDRASQLHASCEATLNTDRKIPESAVHDDDTYQPLLQQTKLPNNDDYMKVDKHTFSFNTPQCTSEPVYAEVETTEM